MGKDKRKTINTDVKHQIKQQVKPSNQLKDWPAGRYKIVESATNVIYYINRAQKKNKSISTEATTSPEKQSPRHTQSSFILIIIF